MCSLRRLCWLFRGKKSPFIYFSYLQYFTLTLLRSEKGDLIYVLEETKLTSEDKIGTV